jgi:hypothetical protein
MAEFSWPEVKVDTLSSLSTTSRVNVPIAVFLRRLVERHADGLIRPLIVPHVS